MAKKKILLENKYSYNRNTKNAKPSTSDVKISGFYAFNSPISERVLLSEETLRIFHKNSSIKQQGNIWPAIPSERYGEGLEAIVSALTQKRNSPQDLMEQTIAADKELAYHFLGTVGEEAIERKIQNNGRQLFIAKNSFNKKTINKNLVAFAIEDNKIMTLDGHSFSNGQWQNTAFGSKTLISSGVSFTVDDYGNFETNSTLKEMIERVNPNADTSNISITQLSLVLDDSVSEYAKDSPAFNRKIIIAGSKEEIQEFLSENSLLYGEKNKSGNYKLIEEAKSGIQRNFLTETKNGKQLKQKKYRSNKNLVTDVIKDGTVKTLNDAPGRRVRDNPWTQMIDLHKKINDLLKGNGLEETQENTRSVLKSLLENSSELSLAISENADLDQQTQINGMKNMLDSLVKKSGGIKRAKNAIYNLAVATDHFQEILPIMEHALLQINASIPEGFDVEQAEEYRKFAVKQVVDALSANAANNLNIQSTDSSNGVVFGMHKNYYELDFSKAPNASVSQAVFQNSNLTKNTEKNILKINLDIETPDNLINNFIKMYGLDQNDFMSEDRKKELLFTVARDMKNQGLGSMYSEILGPNKQQFANKSSQEFAQYIMDSLKEHRNINPTSGFISSNTVHNVLNPTQLSAAFASKEAGINIVNEVLAGIVPENFINTRLNIDGKNEQLIKRLVKEYFVQPFDENVRDTLKNTYKHSVKQLDAIELLHNKVSLGYTKYAENLFAIMDKLPNAKLTIDPGTETFIVEAGGNVYDLSNRFARAKFENGLFVTKVGKTNILNTFAVDSKGELISNVHKAVPYVSASKTDNPLHFMEKFVKNAAATLREGVKVENFNQKERSTQFSVDVSSFYDNFLTHVKKSGIAETPYGKKLAEAFLNNKAKPYSQWSYSQKIIASDYIVDIISKTASSETVRLMENATGAIGHSLVEKGYMGTLTTNFSTEQFMDSKRDINNQIQFKTFDKNKALNTIKAYKSDILLNTSVKTKQGIATGNVKLEGLSGNRINNLTAKSLAINPDDFKEKIFRIIRSNKYSTDSVEYKALTNILNLTNLEEGGALASAEFFDILGMQTSIQKIDMHENIVKSTKDAEAIRTFNALVPKVTMDENGSINFVYTRGKALNQSDPIFNIINYNNSITQEYAKYDGVLKFGFFTQSGELASEADVQNHVYKTFGSNKILSSEDFMNKASELYSGKYYLEKTFADTQIKIMENNSEKHMAIALIGQLGEYDKRVEGVINDLGLEKLKGRSISSDLHTALKDGNLEALKSYSSKKINKSTYVKILKKHGLTQKSFGEALQQERNILSKLFFEITGGAHFVSIDETAKHGSFGAIATNVLDTFVVDEINKLKASGYSHKEAEKKAAILAYDKFGKFFSGNLAIDENNKLYLKEFSAGQSIDFEGIQQAYPIENKPVAKTFSLKVDANVFKDTGQKITDRERNSLAADRMRYSETTLNRIKSKIGEENFNKRFAHVFDANGKIKEEYLNKGMFDDSLKHIFNNQFASTQDKVLVMKNGVVLTDVLDTLSKTERKRVEESLSVITSKYNEIKNVSLNAATKVSASASSIVATYFNDGRIDLSAIESRGFKKLAINNLQSSRGRNIEYLANFSDEINPLIDDIILDLTNDSILDKEMMANADIKTKIAVNHAPYSTLKNGDTLTLDDQRKALDSIIELRKEIGETTDFDKLEKQYSQLKIKTDLLSEMSASSGTKKEGGYLKETSYTYSGPQMTGKGFINNVTTDSLTGKAYSQFDTMMFEGKSLTEHYKNGLFFDFNIMSEDSFRKAGYFDPEYMKSIGASSEDEARRIFQTEGIMSFSTRYPVKYEGSIRPVMAYLSTGYLEGNANITSFHGAIRAKQDSDGDTNTLLSIKNSEGFDSLQEKYAKKINPNLQNSFQGPSDAMYVNAAVNNHNYANASIKGNEIAEEIFNLRPAFLNVLSKEQEEQYKQTFNRLLSDVSSEYAVEKNISVKESSNILKNDINLLMHLMHEKGNYSKEELNAAEFFVQSHKTKSALASKSKKEFAGHIDTVFTKLRNLREMTDLTDNQVSLLDSFFEAAEEGFLSAKHSDGRIIDQAFMLEELSSTMRSMEKGKNAQGKLTAWGIKNARQDRLLKGNHKEDFNNAEEAIRESARLIQEMFKNKENVEIANARTETLKNSTGISNKKLIHSIGVMKNDSKQTLFGRSLQVALGISRIDELDKIDQSSEDLINKIASISLEDAEIASSGLHNETSRANVATGISIGEDVNETMRNRKTSSEDVESVMNFTKSKLKKSGIKGKTLAYSALGLAGAVLFSSFVGGNPTKPASAQANETYAQQQSSSQSVMPLADPNYINMNGGQQPGYIININARTDEGRQFAKDAIRQAISTNFATSSINVAMNVQNSSKASAQQIGRILETAFS